MDRSCYDRREDDTPTEDERRSESCDWLNSLVDFLFHQLRDSPELKKLVSVGGHSNKMCTYIHMVTMLHVG